ncbi:redoxin family protein, partial [Neisseria sp. P0015.S010]
GKRKVLNIFHSIDTDICSQSVRTYNKRASSLNNNVVFCISAYLPFAQARFWGAEGLDYVLTLYKFRSSFSYDYGVTLT